MRAFFRHTLDLLRARGYLPSHLRIFLRDLFDLRALPHQLQPNAVHLQAAMDWLCAAQDANNDGGVAARYRLDRGWTPSYPETTGYIIPTFFAYAHRTAVHEYRQRALRMADWLLQRQFECGAFPGHDASVEPRPVVFNTGQIMYGLLIAHQETGRNPYLEASARAGDWLVAQQEPDGTWRRFTYLNRPHTYHTRVAWPLLVLWRLTGVTAYLQSAVRNLDWALRHQLPNGWFTETGFRDNDKPFLHTIAYTVRGLLMAAEILQQHGVGAPQRYFQAGRQAAEALLHRYEIRRYPFAQYDREWRSTERYSCLTGNSQIAVSWLTLHRTTGDPRFLNAALKINDFVKSTQDLTSRNPGIRGGIKGSHPIWGRYIRYSYPNWAPKFFVDALMLEDDLMAQIERESADEHRRAVQTA